MLEMLSSIGAFLSEAFTSEKKDGTRAKKLRLTRQQSRRRSMAGEKEREALNREIARKYIEAHPARLAEWKRRNRAA